MFKYNYVQKNKYTKLVMNTITSYIDSQTTHLVISP